MPPTIYRLRDFEFSIGKYRVNCSWLCNRITKGLLAGLTLASPPVAWSQDPNFDASPSYNPYNAAAARASTPRAPNQPISSTRPPTWPGGPGAMNMPTSPTAIGPQPPSVSKRPKTLPPNLDNAEIIARIGLTEVIQAGEVMPAVNEQLAKMAAQGQISERELELGRVYLVKQRLSQLIETKLVISECKRKIPAENLPKIEEKVNEQFYKEQLPRIMEFAKVATRKELEAKLLATGSSLDAQRRSYFERSMAIQWMHQQVKIDEEITHAQMLDYYRDHLADYESPPRAKWELITARFDKFNSKGEAYQAIATWGNMVLSGAPFAEVAKANSHDISSRDGGLHDWTGQGALVSTVIDGAIFGLPVGKMSQVLEDDRGFHIIRVVEREDFTRKSFIETQVEIKKKIKEKRTADAMHEYLDKLKQRTPVWTILDELDIPSEPQQ